MTARVCLPIFDGAGRIVAHALVADLDAETRLAVLELVALARRDLGVDRVAGVRQVAAIRGVRDEYVRLRDVLS